MKRIGLRQGATFTVVLHNVSQVLALNNIAPAPCDFVCWIAGNPRDGGAIAPSMENGSSTPGSVYSNAFVPADGMVLTFNYDDIVGSSWYGGMVSIGGRIYGRWGDYAHEVIASSSWFAPVPGATFDWDVLTAAVTMQGTDVVIEPPTYPNPTPVPPEPTPTPEPGPTPTPAPTPTPSNWGVLALLALLAFVIFNK